MQRIRNYQGQGLKKCPPVSNNNIVESKLNCFYLYSFSSTVLLSLLSDLLRSSCTSQQQMIQCQGFLVISHVLEKVHNRAVFN